MGALLLGSGTFHLAWMVLTGADWNGPLSLRKPGLFGVSAGLTVWSIAWVMTKLHPHRLDRWLAGALAGGLLLEVGLITLQHWRGVPSHFNRTTTFDAAVEAIMLGLILLVTAGIVWLTLRTCWLPAMDPATAIALRGGMWLLTLSCGLGIVITILGERNLAAGKLPEIWGPAGVLKYPHGAALHAIQTLPILAWLLHQLRVSKSAGLIQAALWSQVLFLVHAFWQTMHGRARFDLDWIGGAIFLVAGLLIFAPLAVIARTLISFASPLRWRSASRNSTTR
jgi:hypothetical protein